MSADRRPPSPSDPRRSPPRRGAGPSGRPGPAEGAPAVRAYLASLPGDRGALARRFDALVAREVPGVNRAIKWGIPFYGVEGRGWFVSCGVIAGALKVTFFQGASLRPPPPSGKGKQLRGIDLWSAGEFDRAPLASWVRQAARLPGYGS